MDGMPPLAHFKVSSFIGMQRISGGGHIYNTCLCTLIVANALRTVFIFFRFAIPAEAFGAQRLVTVMITVMESRLLAKTA